MVKITTEKDLVKTMKMLDKQLVRKLENIEMFYYLRGYIFGREGMVTTTDIEKINSVIELRKK